MASSSSSRRSFRDRRPGNRRHYHGRESDTPVRAQPEIPSEIEEHRDVTWRREGARQVSTALEAERFIQQVGFAACLTDSRRPGPSLYIAVCGRRDAVM